MNLKIIASAVFVIFIFGCSGASPIPQIEQRALVDLECSNLEEIKDLGKKLYRAHGCGKTATYEVTSCSVVDCIFHKVSSE